MSEPSLLSSPSLGNDVDRAAGYYDFGSFTIDAQSRLVFRGADVLPMTPKTFDLLFVLVQNSGRVVTKSEMLDTVWPGCFVEEGSITQHIWRLRRMLDHNRRGQAVIETIPKRGYRFVCPVHWRPMCMPRSRPPAQRSAVEPGSFGPFTTIALVRVRSLSGRSEHEFLSNAFWELLACELGQCPCVRVCAAEAVLEARSTLALRDAASFSPGTLSLVRELLGCELAVSASYLVSGNSMRLNVVMQAAQTGVTVATLTETGAFENLLGLVARMGERMRETLS